MTVVFISNIKKSRHNNDSLLDGNLFFDMDNSTHHDVFVSLIPADKLAISLTRYAAIFLSLIFVFEHCA